MKSTWLYINGWETADFVTSLHIIPQSIFSVKKVFEIKSSDSSDIIFELRINTFFDLACSKLCLHFLSWDQKIVFLKCLQLNQGVYESTHKWLLKYKYPFLVLQLFYCVKVPSVTHRIEKLYSLSWIWRFLSSIPASCICWRCRAILITFLLHTR